MASQEEKSIKLELFYVSSRDVRCNDGYYFSKDKNDAMKKFREPAGFSLPAGMQADSCNFSMAITEKNAWTLSHIKVFETEEKAINAAVDFEAEIIFDGRDIAEKEAKSSKIKEHKKECLDTFKTTAKNNKMDISFSTFKGKFLDVINESENNFIRKLDDLNVEDFDSCEDFDKKVHEYIRGEQGGETHHSRAFISKLDALKGKLNPEPEVGQSFKRAG